MKQDVNREEIARGALKDLREGLANDGADLALEKVAEDELIIRLVFTDETCLDCIVPPPILRSLVSDELQTRGLSGEVTVIDPREA